MQKTYDVIIIGAGVSGSYLGYLLAKNGLDVLILEKDPSTKKDSGIVSGKIESFIKIKRNLVKTRIKRMKFVSPAGKFFYLRSETPFAFILYRDRFEKYMRKLAVKAGARIIYRECKGFRILENCVEVEAGETYESKIIVGCDGANSLVRQKLGIKPPKIFNGLLSLGRFSRKQDEIEVHLNKFYSPHFFAWSIPQAGETGTITKTSPSDYIKYYHEKIGFKQRKTHIHPIPIGFTRSYHKRALLLGDSCGQVKPISGGGIIYAMTCANCAAETICESVHLGIYSKRLLSKYEKKWKKELGREQMLQNLARKAYRRMNNRDIDELFTVFGSHVESARDFEYDKLSSIVAKMPKMAMLKYLLRYIPLMLEWSHD